MSADPTPPPVSRFDPDKGRKLLAEAEAWAAAEAKVKPVSEIVTAPGNPFAKMLANLPETVEIPYELTPEGVRDAEFKRIIDEQFIGAVDPSRVRNRRAFDSVVSWEGRFPGPVIVGTTGYGKTFAAWQALRELYVKKAKPFWWATARNLVLEMERYEQRECAPEFFRYIELRPVWFIDDLDKINWDFVSQQQLLFAFVDHVYRKRWPCIVTTNRDRTWWKEKMGDAFVRRLFTDAFFVAEFR